MISEEEVLKIQGLKEKGYAKARVAKTLRLSRGTVSKYWGGRGDTVSLSALNKRFEECFRWMECSNCRLMYWAPKFLPAWQCPGCGSYRRWKEQWFKEKAKD